MDPMDDDHEERFKHLLQPIRDLAQNWNVDIASSLEDYLQDLEEIKITLDGGASKVNFAEAALLIQGSTSVYSRKVEHVYQLVLRTIEFLTQQKHANANAAKHGNKNMAGDGDDDFAGDDTMFLPLDDVLEEGKHIDLQVHPNTATIANSSNNNSNSLAGGSRRSRSGRRSSIAPGNSAVSFGENAYGYHSTKDWGGGEACMPGATGGGGGGGNEINRPAMFLTEQDYGNSFKMSTCTVDQSGALLIEGAPMSSSMSSFNGTRTAPSAAAGVGQNNSFSSNFWGGLQQEGFGQEEGGACDAGDNGGFGYNGNGDDDDDSDGDDGGAGFDEGVGGFGGGEDAGVEESKGGEVEPSTLQGLRTPVAGRELRQRQQHEQQQQQARIEAETHKRADPWAQVDPHDPGKATARPIRKGRTYRLPPHQRQKKSRAKDKQGSGEDLERCMQQEAGTGAGESWVSHKGNLILSIPLHGLAYPEFHYVGRREKQRKMRLGRLARQQAREFMGREEFLPEASSSSASASILAAERARITTDQQEQDPALDGYRSCGGFSSDGGGGGGDFGEGGGYDDYGGGGMSDDDDYGWGGGEEGGAGGVVAPISLEDAFRDKPQTYEDLCRSHIEAFMRGTERYAAETQLSRRVGAWQNKLEPLMRSQENRQAFDIHMYGQSVLSSVAKALTPAQRAKIQKAKKGESCKAAKELSKGKEMAGMEEIPPVDFGTVVSGKQQFEVCRLFLASLQLANNGNVRLSHGQYAADQASTPFRLELLSLQDADNMTGYFAPSAAAGIGTGPENVE